jgi:hypothetical protein
MTAEAVRTRPIPAQPEPAGADVAQPLPASSPHSLVLIEEPVLAWTVAKIAGLVAITALSAALTAAIVIGAALFAVLTIG